jgi:dUTP pyrophosphatase
MLPTKSSHKPQYSGDSGYDVYANFNGTQYEDYLLLLPGDHIKVPTGVSPRIQGIFWQTYMQSVVVGNTVCVDYSKDPIHIPHYLELQVRPKSGRAYHEKLTVTNTPGTIDNSYTGELQILLSNLGNNSIQIYHGQKIAQIIPQFVPELGEPVWVDDNYESPVDYQRQGGFGSTGL